MSEPGYPRFPHGRVAAAAAPDGSRAALVAVTCSSDRLARSGAFAEYVDRLCRHVLLRGPRDVGELARQDWSYDGGTVEEAQRRFAEGVGEAVRVKQLARYENPEGIVWAYVPPDGGRGVLLSITSSCPVREVRDVAFQLGGQILLEQTGEWVVGDGGPEELFDPADLAARPWSRDPRLTVQQVLDRRLGDGARLEAYVRFTVGDASR